MEERFSIRFDGEAFESHTVSATALAQSLLALDALSRRAALEVYGKNARIDVKVDADFKPGSFMMDLIVYASSNPEAALVTASGAGGAVAILAGVFKLAKWAFGRKVREVSGEGDGVGVRNDAGQVSVYDRCVVTIYNNARTASNLSRLTQTLDIDGASGIRIVQEGKIIESIGKEDRPMFRQDDEPVLTDSESELLLEVVGPMLNGSPSGWRFGEGDDGIEFNATVEDEAFLLKVRSNEVRFVFGTSILAVVRTVQRKGIRTRTERTIVEVKAVYQPE